jgi:hypothetical protein
MVVWFLRIDGTYVLLDNARFNSLRSPGWWEVVLARKPGSANSLARIRAELLRG